MAPLVRTLFVLALLSSLLLTSARAEPGRAEPGRALPGLVPDLRLLVDVSEDMQELDPEDLRLQTLEMMIRLLPAGSRVSIWAFDENVRLLLPTGTVDGEWRDQALAALSGLEPGSPRSNIPAALAAATADLAKLGAGYRSSVVLLTVGRVKVADSPMVSVSAARKMLSGLAVELGEQEVPVHTVAFAREADRQFLRTLARQTGGTSVKAEEAAELGGIFLNILEMVAPTVRQPVFGRKFRVDDSVKEFVVLAQLPRLVGSLKLAAPDGSVYSAADNPGEIRWFRNQHLNMARVSKPLAGNWRLQFPKDSSARVYVESGLELQVGHLPYYMTAGNEATIDLRLVKDGSVITDPQALARYALFLEVNPLGGSTTRIRLDNPPADGVITASAGPLEAGRYRLVIRLEGEGIERELPFNMEVGAPAEQPTLVTRGEEILEDDYRAPLIWLAGITTTGLVLVWYLLRRRQRRKLELWQKRAREMQKTGQKNTLRGAPAVSGEPPPRDSGSLD